MLKPKKKKKRKTILEKPDRAKVPARTKKKLNLG